MEGPAWVHEIKWDGYRVSFILGGAATIRTRRGLDWTARFPAIAAALPGIKARSAIIDGEAVVLDENGKSSFAALQSALTRHGAEAAVLYAFDLLWLDGEDLRAKPLSERRNALTGLIGQCPAIRLSEEYAGDGDAFFATACDYGLEGIVSKRIDRPYRSGVGRDWLKTKCGMSGVITVIGYEPSSTARGLFGSLLLASETPDGVHYVGEVGTGFPVAVAAELKRALDSIRVAVSPVKRLRIKGAVWVEPRLRAEVDYRGRTADGRLRHASFKGIVE